VVGRKVKREETLQSGRKESYQREETLEKLKEGKLTERGKRGNPGKVEGRKVNREMKPWKT
jgi:hypothetical protein